MEVATIMAPDMPREDTPAAAAYIRELRSRLGLTQHELANRLDVGDSAIARWESGYREPRLPHYRRTIERLARTVDMGPMPKYGTRQDPPPD